jgi:3-oxoacyl-[acyl-carrier-protein] synthase III
VTERRPPASRILGTGHYLPSKVLTNADLEKIVDTSDTWIRTRTGIHQRHVAAPEEASSDMASHAARAAIEAAGILPTDIDLILVATVTPDMPLPSTAMFVQQKIGAKPHCPGMDIVAACAGFVYGLSTADAFIRAGAAKHVLVIGVELLTRIVDWDDRSTCVLFGDGAGAVVVGPSEPGSGRGILTTRIHADGSLSGALCIPGGGSRTPFSVDVLEKKQHLVHMHGQDVFKFAVKALSQATTAAIADAGLTEAEIDWVIPHQANTRILDGVQQRVNIPKERFFINIQDTANTSSASVPIALDQAVRSGAVKEGQNIVFCALGGGIAWGSAVVRW